MPLKDRPSPGGDSFLNLKPKTLKSPRSRAALGVRRVFFLRPYSITRSYFHTTVASHSFSIVFIMSHTYPSLKVLLGLKRYTVHVQGYEVLSFQRRSVFSLRFDSIYRSKHLIWLAFAPDNRFWKVVGLKAPYAIHSSRGQSITRKTARTSKRPPTMTPTRPPSKTTRKNLAILCMTKL